MDHILRFNKFNFLTEKIQPITTNWFIIDRESSFPKKEGNGYFIFNQEGLFSIVYLRKENGGESILNFYSSKEASPDKQTLCECKIISRNGEDESKDKFEDINQVNVWEIASVFFDYCDVEKSTKEVYDRFMMGFSKTMKEVFKHESEDQIPSSYKSFYKYISEFTKSKNPKIDSKILKDNSDFFETINSFITFFKKTT